jgi:hypothetical protein
MGTWIDWVLGLTVCGVVLRCCIAAAADPSLTQAHRLEHKLELKDSHGGVAGASGMIWTIEPTGHWTMSRFFKSGGQPEHVEPPIHRGILNGAQMGQIAGIIQQERLVVLPAHIGPKPSVNPHLVTLRFGSHQSTLTLGGTIKIERAQPPRDGPQAAEAGRFLSVARTILKFLPTR